MVVINPVIPGVFPLQIIPIEFCGGFFDAMPSIGSSSRIVLSNTSAGEEEDSRKMPSAPLRRRLGILKRLKETLQDQTRLQQLSFTENLCLFRSILTLC